MREAFFDNDDSPNKPRFYLSLGDAVSFLDALDPESVDLVVTDPAYESLEKWRKLGTKTRLKKSGGSSNEWFDIFPNTRFEELFRAVYRVLKPNTHFYLLCDQETMFFAKPIGEQVGFKFWKPLIFNKLRIGMGYHYRAQYELILFFEKGKRKLNSNSISDVLSFPRIFRGYPTEKPVELLEVMVCQSTNPREIVVDPFMGSGSAGIAALQSERHFAGNDLSKRSLEHMKNRVALVSADQVETFRELKDELP